MRHHIAPPTPNSNNADEASARITHTAPPLTCSAGRRLREHREATVAGRRRQVPSVRRERQLRDRQTVRRQSPGRRPAGGVPQPDLGGLRCLRLRGAPLAGRSTVTGVMTATLCCGSVAPADTVATWRMTDPAEYAAHDELCRIIWIWMSAKCTLSRQVKSRACRAVKVVRITSVPRGTMRTVQALASRRPEGCAAMAYRLFPWPYSLCTSGHRVLPARCSSSGGPATSIASRSDSWQGRVTLPSKQ